MTKIKYIIVAICCVFAFGTEYSISAQISESPRKVLFYSSEDTRLPGAITIEEAIRSTFAKDPLKKVAFYNESQDNARIPNDKYEAEYVAFLRRKYEGEKIDLIFIRGATGLRFLLKHESEIFTAVPKVFITNDQPEISALNLGPNVTGVNAELQLNPTLDLILQQHPQTKRVVVITGSSTRDEFYLEKARKDFSGYLNKVEISYLSKLPIADLQKAVSSLPPDNIVLFVSYGRDPAGNGYSLPGAISLVLPSSSVPVYAVGDTAMGTGVVGGKMLSFQLMGERGAEMGLRILSGEKPSDIPPQNVESVLMFDWRALRRWNISEQALPAESIVRNKEPTFWEQYKWQAIGAATFSIFQSLLIGWLLFIQARRRKAENESLRFAALVEAEHKKLDDVVANVPGIVWESRVGSDPDERRIEFVSDHVEQMLGYTPAEISSIPNFWMSIVLKEDQTALMETTRAILAGEQRGVQQFRCVKKDGEVIWAEANLVATFDEDGTVAGIRGVAIDVTNRKRAEDKLRSRELELMEAQRLSQIGSWEWNPSSDTVTWTEELYRIAGLDPSQPAPNFEQHSNLYTPESYKLLVSTVAMALDSGAPYELELEMIRSDKRKVWTSMRGEVIHGDDPNIVRLRGTLQDTSNRKKAEQELRNALEEVNQLQKQLSEENIYLKEVIKLEHNFEEIIGRSKALKYVLFKIEQVAPTDATVLITGETGTGKELVARAIHDASTRKTRPLVKVNCAALSATLIESELFGHERGAFTGASARKIGRFELAHGATIFLDEIGELPLELQSKLLRVIQEGEFERLGSTKTIKADVRIIAATNRNLKAEVQNGNFREDLLFRLNVFPITVPPLRERKDDIPELIEYFVSRFSKKHGKNITAVPPAAMRDLLKYSYPGNIRELSNIIERSVINTPGDKLRVSEVFETAKAENGFSEFGETLEAVERKYIIQTLENTNWKIHGANGAAQVLGLNSSTLRTRMTKLGISKKQAQTNNA